MNNATKTTKKNNTETIYVIESVTDDERHRSSRIGTGDAKRGKTLLHPQAFQSLPNVPVSHALADMGNGIKKKLKRSLPEYEFYLSIS